MKVILNILHHINKKKGVGQAEINFNLKTRCLCMTRRLIEHDDLGL
jgi:hypothetical protein